MRLTPGKLEHLVILGLNTAFSTVNSYHKTDACAIRTVDFKEMLDGRLIENAERSLTTTGIYLTNYLIRALI